MSKPDNLAKALALAKGGVAVFPVKMPDKRPLVLWDDAATTDPKQIAQWWTLEYRDAAIGMHMGKSDLVGVDLDLDKGQGAGRDNLKAAGIELPKTLRYKTRSGGWHHVFAAPEGKALTIAQGVPVPGVDIRAGVGFLIYYGGLPAKGFRDELAAAPEWSLVTTRSSATKSGKPTKAERAEVDAWLEAQRKGEPSKAALAAAKRIKREGTTHDVLLEAVAELVKRGTGGERGIRPLLTKARARYVERYPESGRHFDNALAGSVRHHGMPPTTIKAPKGKRPKVAATEGAGVLDEVRAQLERFVSFPSDHHSIAVTLWTAHVHLIGCFDNTPRLSFQSPEAGSGKSRALEVTAKMTPDPIEAQNVSVAYLARKLDETGGRSAAFLDEVDTIFDPRVKSASSEELRGILNAGYRKGATYGRAAVRGKEVVTEDIACFAPVALAGLGDIPDTIRTRAVVIPMRRRANDEVIEPYRQRVNGAELERTRDRLAGWARSVRKVVTGAPELPDGITDRDADVWEPLIAVADAAGGEWPALARAAAVALVMFSRDRPATIGVRLLSDTRRIIGDRKRISKDELLHHLIALDESPWGDLGGRGPIDGRYLTKMFGPYGIPLAHTIRFDPSAGGTARGWDARDFADAWSRYDTKPPRSSVTPIDE